MKILVSLVVLVGCMFVLVRYLEKHSIFYPSKVMDITPDRFGLSFEDVYLTTEDGVRLNGWLVLHPSAKATLLFLHGNAGNISDRLIKIRMFHEVGVNIFILDYRGYGHSEGIPSEEGVYRDARAAFDYLKNRADFKEMPIVVYGGSLGGAAAIDLATHRSIDALIIDSSFPSAAAMSRLIYPMIPTCFLAVKFDSIHKIKSLTMPKLFMHSIEDRTVPIHLGRQLFDAAPAPKDFVELTGGHNDAHIDCKEKFFGAIKSFLTKNGWL